MKNQLSKMKWPLGFLLLMVITFFSIYAWLYYSNIGETHWSLNLTLSLGSSFLSTIVTILAVNMYISAKSDEDSEKIKRACVMTLRPGISRAASIFSIINKSTTKTNRDGEVVAIADFFRGLDMVELSELDPSRPAPIASIGHDGKILKSLLWQDYTSSELSFFKKNIEDFLVRYSIFLDEEIIQVCEDILYDKTFIRLVNKDSKYVTAFVWKGFTTERMSWEAPLRVCFEKIARLSDVFSNYAGAELNIKLDWCSKTSPKLGSEIGSNKERLQYF